MVTINHYNRFLYFYTTETNAFIINQMKKQNQKSIKKQSRGRPKNVAPPETASKLSSVLDNVQMSYALTFLWTKQILAGTKKKQKRIGHSQKGFNIYDKVSDQYSFDSLESDLREWNASNISSRQNFKSYFQYMTGIGPKIVFKELLGIGELYLQLRKILNPEESLTQLRRILIFGDSNDIDRRFAYIRFSYFALIKLKLQRINSKIRERVEKLWAIFIILYSYILYCLDIDLPKNKYRQALFADTASWNDNSSTITLVQVVEQTDQDDFQRNTEILQQVLEKLEEKNKNKGSLDSNKQTKKDSVVKIEDDNYQFKFQDFNIQEQQSSENGKGFDKQHFIRTGQSINQIKDVIVSAKYEQQSSSENGKGFDEQNKIASRSSQKPNQKPQIQHQKIEEDDYVPFYLRKRQKQEVDFKKRPRPQSVNQEQDKRKKKVKQQ